MLHDGLGEESEFAQAHPLLNFAWFILVLGITMFAMHPIFLAVSFVASWVYSIILRGRKAVKFNCFLVIFALVIMTLLNTLNVHNGVTVLFYLNGNRITLEAIVFGAASAVMLSSMIIWFSCFNVVMKSDKIVYLFGRVAPVIALTISMIFRFIPLLQSRFAEITAGQRCMGRTLTGKSLIRTARQLAKEVSILIAWSLEASIESSDSMEARGYGLKGRTSFHLYKLCRRDKLLLAATLLAGGLAVAGCAAGLMTIYYYPKIILPVLSSGQLGCLVAYICLLILPVWLDLSGVKKWRLLNSEM